MYSICTLVYLYIIPILKCLYCLTITKRIQYNISLQNLFNFKSLLVMLTCNNENVARRMYFVMGPISTDHPLIGLPPNMCHCASAMQCMLSWMNRLNNAVSFHLSKSIYRLYRHCKSSTLTGATVALLTAPNKPVKISVLSLPLPTTLFVPFNSNVS